MSQGTPSQSPTRRERRDAPFGGRLGRFRARAVHDLGDLDARGRLGHPPRPLQLALMIAFLIVGVGVTSFALGRSEGSSLVYLLITAVAVFGIAVAVGTALAVAEYRASQQSDLASAELLALHTELESVREEAETRLHDARALTFAMDSALHALRRPVGGGPVVGALSEQVSHLRRLLAPRPSVTPEPIEMSDVLDVVGSFAILHGVAVRRDGTCEMSVLADRGRVVDILQNLVDNARKYAPGSPVHIRCREAGPFVKVIVEDEGPGIDIVDADALFQLGARSETSGGGFGMGLGIVRRLAEGMGGAVWYEPGSTGGARFVVKLPRFLASDQTERVRTP